MKKFKPTHTAIIIGNDARTPDNYHQPVKLKATKTMLVCSRCRRWRIDGSGFGTWPLTSLIDIKPIENQTP